MQVCIEIHKSHTLQHVGIIMQSVQHVVMYDLYVSLYKLAFLSLLIKSQEKFIYQMKALVNESFCRKKQAV